MYLTIPMTMSLGAFAALMDAAAAMKQSETDAGQPSRGDAVGPMPNVQQAIDLTRQISTEKAEHQHYNYLTAHEVLLDRMHGNLEGQEKSADRDEMIKRVQRKRKTLPDFHQQAFDDVAENRQQRYAQAHRRFLKHGYPKVNREIRDRLHKSVPLQPWDDVSREEQLQRLRKVHEQERLKADTMQRNLLKKHKGRAVEPDRVKQHALATEALEQAVNSNPSYLSDLHREQETRLVRDGAGALSPHTQRMMQQHDDGPDGPLRTLLHPRKFNVPSDDSDLEISHESPKARQ